MASSDGGVGTPTGSVVFTIDGSARQTFTETLNSSGVATLTIPNSPPANANPTLATANCVPPGAGLKVGQHTITAVYQGDDDFARARRLRCP